jgi:hypothetical protein
VGRGAEAGRLERAIPLRLLLDDALKDDVRMCTVTPLRPAAASVEDSELWNRVVVAAGARGLAGDALREAVLAHAVSGLCASIAGDEQILALGGFAEEDEDAEGWVGARFQARQLGLQDQAAIIVLFLISERTTSCAARSPYARALVETAARRFGAPSSVSDAAVRELLAAHEAAFARFLDAQRELTAELLQGRDEVTLHRGVRTTDPVKAGEENPGLLPLSSFSTSAARALSLARHGRDAGGAGEIVLLSAVVPAERILATPATGAGAVLEREVVLAVGHCADRVTVTLPDAAGTETVSQPTK